LTLVFINSRVGTVEEIEDEVTIEPKITGEMLGSTAINIMSELGLSINNFIGKATDGYIVMTYDIKNQRYIN